jgi:acetylornithine deacetylase/succinyl-diaminopimelate desuccinylase-like protein
MKTPFLALLFLVIVSPVSAEEAVDLDLINQIRHEGFDNSQVMDIAWHLTEVIGARVTGSPAMVRANEWTRDKMTEWGLENARLEEYQFGRGWDWQSCRVDLQGDAAKSLSAMPQAWTPGTGGPVRGEVVRLDAEDEEGLAEFEGEFAGKIILLSEAKEVEPRDSAAFSRIGAEELHEMHEFEIPRESSGPTWRKRMRKRAIFRRALDSFLHEEGALAIIEHSSRNHGILRVPRGAQPDDPERSLVPALTMMTEQYNRLVRLVEHEEPVELEIEISARFHGEIDSPAYNTLAEIRGGKKSGEIVMIGAHLDSYHAGTGATDNAAGVAVMMEAVRILQAIGAEPERTIRVGLWSGEEQGLLGSRAWVEQRVASRPAPTDSASLALPRSFRKKEGPLSFHEDYERISVYFNFDNGGGRIRGIHTQENVAVVPIFDALLAPFADLGVETVSTNNTGGTDHQSFDRVGVPGFQFIQDELDYFPQTHHSHVDTWDHLQREDLMQAAVIVASLAIHAANRADQFPRKPIETE